MRCRLLLKLTILFLISSLTPLLFLVGMVIFAGVSPDGAREGIGVPPWLPNTLLLLVGGGSNY
ncbi:MAG TPA: hypothetical protein EYP85_17195 [Armatimonadetes bacterium]|nr:hypothetical protein [Armatimonadota bacterium]